MIENLRKKAAGAIALTGVLGLGGLVLSKPSPLSLKVSNDGHVMDTREEFKRHGLEALSINFGYQGLTVEMREGQHFFELIPGADLSVAESFLTQLGYDRVESSTISGQVLLGGATNPEVIARLEEGIYAK